MSYITTYNIYDAFHLVSQPIAVTFFSMNSVFRLTIIISFLVHLSVYVALTMNFDEIPQKAPNDEASIMEFVLDQPPTAPPQSIESEPEADKPPPSRHMEDDITKANTSDGLAESGGKQTPKPKGQESTEFNQTDAASQADVPELLSSTLSSFIQQAIKNVKVEQASDSQDKKQLGEQLAAQDDSGKDDAMVQSALDKAEEEKARWRNMVLKRISEQITFVWVKPDGTRPSQSGVIRMNVDSEGYLEGAWVYRPSGNALLDASILRAIRSVWHFQIPKSDTLNRYYRQLEFHYQGGNETD